MKKNRLFTNSILVATLLLVGIGASAKNAQTQRCIRTLMTQPACVSLANAKWFCSTVSNSAEATWLIKNCLAGFNGGFFSRQAVVAQCLGGYKLSKIAAENKSLCE